MFFLNYANIYQNFCHFLITLCAFNAFFVNRRSKKKASHPSRTESPKKHKPFNLTKSINYLTTMKLGQNSNNDLCTPTVMLGLIFPSVPSEAPAPMPRLHFFGFWNFVTVITSVR